MVADVRLQIAGGAAEGGDAFEGGREGLLALVLQRPEGGDDMLRGEPLVGDGGRVAALGGVGLLGGRVQEGGERAEGGDPRGGRRAGVLREGGEGLAGERGGVGFPGLAPRKDDAPEIYGLRERGKMEMEYLN